MEDPDRNSFFDFLKAIFYIGYGDPESPFKHMTKLIFKAGPITAERPRAKAIGEQFVKLIY